MAKSVPVEVSVKDVPEVRDELVRLYGRIDVLTAGIRYALSLLDSGENVRPILERALDGAMTDQPSTQEPHNHREYVEGCFRCDLSREEAKRPSLAADIIDDHPWHGSQDVEGEARTEEAAEHRDSGSSNSPSTTQEAEKALEAVQHVAEHLKHYPDQPLDKGCRDRISDALAALRSLRTQHTEMQEERDKAVAELKYAQGGQYVGEMTKLRIQHTKDREEIERLKGELAKALLAVAFLEDDADAANRHITKQGEDYNALVSLRTKDQERIERLGEIRLPCCGDVLAQHTSNGFPVECECGCRQVLNTPDTQGEEAGCQ